MTVDEFFVTLMVIGGFATVLGILIFLPSTHKREKEHKKRTRQDMRYWNPVKRRYWDEC